MWTARHALEVLVLLVILNLVKGLWKFLAECACIYIYSEGGERAKRHSHTHHLFVGWARGQPPGQLYIYSEGGEQAKPHSHTHHLFAGWARAQPPSQLPRYLSQATLHPTKCRIYLYFLCWRWRWNFCNYILAQKQCHPLPKKLKEKKRTEKKKKYHGWQHNSY